MPQVFCLVTA